MDLIHIERDDAIAVVTLDRPPANPLDPTLLDPGLSALAELQEDRTASVLRNRKRDST